MEQMDDTRTLSRSDARLPRLLVLLSVLLLIAAATAAVTMGRYLPSALATLAFSSLTGSVIAGRHALREY